MNNLKTIRERLKLTAAQCAKDCNVAYSTWWRWETGKTRMLEDEIVKVCQTLNISADELLGIER